MAIIKSDDITNLALMDLQIQSMWEMYEELNPDLKFRIQSSSVLFPEIETSTRKPTGSKHIAGFVPIETITLSFLETTNFSIYEYLHKWYTEIFDEKRMVFLSGNHRKNFIIGFQHDVAVPVPFVPSSGMRLYNKVFRVENMIIQKIEDVPLSYENGGPLIIEAKFAVDRIYDISSIVGGASAELTGIQAVL